MSIEKSITSLNELLEDAVLHNATDVHIAVGARPRYRLYGDLCDMNYSVITDRVAERLLIDGFLDAYARTHLNSEGQWDRSYEIREGTRTSDGHIVSIGARFRANIFKQKGALAGVFRILNSSVPSAEKLGLPYTIFNLYKKRKGLVLVVGPTGSGKSTTLASIIDLINKNLYKQIITLEEPIEYLHWHSRSNVCQREVGTDVSDFKSGLRASLRQDPDVILVGEMRDLETTDIAIKAAETGHLVCSTLHTLGASETINRIMDMYPEKQRQLVRGMLSSVIEAIVSQQLLPRIDGKGYVLALEFLSKTKEVQRLIREGNVFELNKYIHSEEAKELGMYTMDDSIYALYTQNKITQEVALNYALDRKEMSKRLNS